MPPISRRATRYLAGALLVSAVVTSGTAAVLVGIAIAEGGTPVEQARLALPINSGITDSGGRLVQVTPGGPGWTAGLRPGWALDTRPGEPGVPGAVLACGPPGCRIYFDLQTQFRVGGRLFYDVVAIGLAVLGVVTWAWRPRLSGVLAIASVAMSGPTYALLGHAPLFPGLYLAALIGLPAWMRLTHPSQLWTLLVPVTVIVAVAWAGIWLALPTVYDLAESVRVFVIGGTVLLGLGVTSGALALVDVPITRGRGVDGAVSIGVIGLAALAWWLAILPDSVTATAVAFSALLAYFAFRRQVRRVLARVRFAELGQRSSLQALEAERSRVARDLHDGPIQELAAVIHRLDRPGGPAAEADRLREIARHLRDVSVSLRPPVLDDVGLRAAITEIADRHSLESGVPIRVVLDDSTDIERASRPPPDVELAVYRIVQEGVTNALRHAHASCIEVIGTIGRSSLRVAITDDGRGIDWQSVLLAERAGRLGMTSMRERAAIVGAILTISAAEDGAGTAIIVQWSNP